MRDLYISRISLSILLRPNRQTDPLNIKIAHRYNVQYSMNVGIGNEAAKFPFAISDFWQREAHELQVKGDRRKEGLEEIL